MSGFFCLPLYCGKEVWKLEGKIIFQNSGGTPIQGAEVSSPDSNHFITGRFGWFELEFKENKEAGDIVHLTVLKKGLRVADEEKLKVVLKKYYNFVEIEMCKKASRIQNLVSKKDVNMILDEIRELRSDIKTVNKSVSEYKIHTEPYLKRQVLKPAISNEQVDEINKIHEGALFYSQQGDIDKALEIIKDLIMDNNIRNALENIEKLKTIIKNCADLYMFKASLYISKNNLGKISKNINHLNNALYYYQKSLIIIEKLAIKEPEKFWLDYCNALMNCAVVYKEMLDINHTFENKTKGISLVNRVIKILKKYQKFTDGKEAMKNAINLKKNFEELSVEE